MEWLQYIKLWSHVFNNINAYKTQLQCRLKKIIIKFTKYSKPKNKWDHCTDINFTKILFYYYSYIILFAVTLIIENLILENIQIFNTHYL